MSLLCFILCFTMMTSPKILLLEEQMVMVEPYQTETLEEQPVEEQPSTHLWGTCTLTFYCPGPCCCGQWSSGYTASGTLATAGRTVACGDLPFGTRLMIEGHEYVVEDRGVNGMWVDIFVNSHAEACQRGMYQAEVYIIDG